MGNFRSLEVWKLSKDLAVSIYKLTNIGKFSKDFGLRDQIRRAAVSISSNISEGDESGSNKHSIRYFNIAKGSSAESNNSSNYCFRNWVYCSGRKRKYCKSM